MPRINKAVFIMYLFTKVFVLVRCHKKCMTGIYVISMFIAFWPNSFKFGFPLPIVQHSSDGCQYWARRRLLFRSTRPRFHIGSLRVTQFCHINVPRIYAYRISLWYCCTCTWITSNWKRSMVKTLIPNFKKNSCKTTKLSQNVHFLPQTPRI